MYRTVFDVPSQEKSQGIRSGHLGDQVLAGLTIDVQVFHSVFVMNVIKCGWC